MGADVYYTIGATHQICEDYAITDKEKFVILADGCSSAKDSDWGARLLVKGLEISLLANASFKSYDFEFHCLDALQRATEWSKKLHLEQECLASTLLCAYKKDNEIMAHITGDGYIIVKRKDGSLEVIEHLFESGAPYYLYYNDQHLNGIYQSTFGQSKLQITNSLVKDKAVTTLNKTVMFPCTSFGYTYFFTDVDFVGIATDGLNSFVRQERTETSLKNVSIPFNEIVEEFCNFKSREGQFVRRRCQKVFRGLNNIKNNDDFSIGIICC